MQGEICSGCRQYVPYSDLVRTQCVKCRCPVSSFHNLCLKFEPIDLCQTCELRIVSFCNDCNELLETTDIITIRCRLCNEPKINTHSKCKAPSEIQRVCERCRVRLKRGEIKDLLEEESQQRRLLLEKKLKETKATLKTSLRCASCDKEASLDVLVLTGCNKQCSQGKVLIHKECKPIQCTSCIIELKSQVEVVSQDVEESQTIWKCPAVHPLSNRGGINVEDYCPSCGQKYDDMQKIDWLKKVQREGGTENLTYEEGQQFFKTLDTQRSIAAHNVISRMVLRDFNAEIMLEFYKLVCEDKSCIKVFDIVSSNFKFKPSSVKEFITVVSDQGRPNYVSLLEAAPTGTSAYMSSAYCQTKPGVSQCHVCEEWQAEVPLLARLKMTEKQGENAFVGLQWYRGYKECGVQISFEDYLKRMMEWQIRKFLPDMLGKLKRTYEEKKENCGHIVPVLITLWDSFSSYYIERMIEICPLLVDEKFENRDLAQESQFALTVFNRKDIWKIKDTAEVEVKVIKVTKDKFETSPANSLLVEMGVFDNVGVVKAPIQNKQVIVNGTTLTNTGKSLSAQGVQYESGKTLTIEVKGKKPKKVEVLME